MTRQRPPQQVPQPAAQPPRHDAYAGFARSAGLFAGVLAAIAVVTALVSTSATSSVPLAGVQMAPAAVRWGNPIARLAMLLAAATMVGTALAARFLDQDYPPDQQPGRPRRPTSIMTVRGHLRRAAMVAAAGWVVAGVVALWLSAYELVTTSPTVSDVLAYVAEIVAAQGLLLSICCAAISGVLAVRRFAHWPVEVRLGLALAGVLPLPLTGHTPGPGWHEVATISVEVHVLAAVSWVGALGAVTLLMARQPPLLAVVIPKFSHLATWCVMAVAATGLASGLLELAMAPTVRLPQALWTTSYGALLIVKVVCLTGISLIAWRVRRRILPSISRGSRTALALWCGWELMVMAVAIGVAVVLARTPTG